MFEVGNVIVRVQCEVEDALNRLRSVQGEMHGSQTAMQATESHASSSVGQIESSFSRTGEGLSGVMRTFAGEAGNLGKMAGGAIEGIGVAGEAAAMQAIPGIGQVVGGLLILQQGAEMAQKAITKLFSDMISNSTLAKLYTEEYNEVMGVLGDTLITAFEPALELVTEIMWDFIDVIEENPELISDVAGACEIAADAFRGAAAALDLFITQAWPLIEPFEVFLSDELIPVFERLFGVISGGGASSMGAFSTAVGSILGVLAPLSTFMTTTLIPGFVWLEDTIRGILDTAWSPLVAAFEGAWTGLQPTLTMLIAFLTQANDLILTVSNGLASIPFVGPGTGENPLSVVPGLPPSVTNNGNNTTVNAAITVINQGLQGAANMGADLADELRRRVTGW